MLGVCSPVGEEEPYRSRSVRLPRDCFVCPDWRPAQRKALERRTICLAESLGIQSAPSGGTCLEEPSCRISELSSKLATMRLEFQEGLAALKGSREAMNSSKQKSLPCARNAPSYTASIWQWRQRAAKETHTKVFQQLASKLAPMVVDHHVAPDAESSDCRTGGAKRLVDPIYPAEAS